MLRSFIFYVCLSTCVSFAQQDSAVSLPETAPNSDDLQVLRSILDQCGMKDAKIENVAEIENGRVVSLNLSNKDVSKDGISKIPEEIGRLTALRTFICKDNSLTVIPWEIGYLEQLQKLDMSSNRLEAITSRISNLKNLVDLDLRHNRIEYLPIEIGDLKNLQFLRLWGNRLTMLCEAVVTLPNLKELYLKDNRLTSLPTGITTMKSLVYIDLIGNKLCNVDPLVHAWMFKDDENYKMNQKCW